MIRCQARISIGEFIFNATVLQSGNFPRVNFPSILVFKFAGAQFSRSFRLESGKRCGVRRARGLRSTPTAGASVGPPSGARGASPPARCSRPRTCRSRGRSRRYPRGGSRSTPYHPLTNCNKMCVKKNVFDCERNYVDF